MATMSQSRARLLAAIDAMDSSPDYLVRLYIDCALEDNAGNVSATARQLFMHRRTLQRIVAKHTPARHPQFEDESRRT